MTIHKDALIARTVAPSVGASATRFENLGAVRNAAWSCRSTPSCSTARRSGGT